MQNKFLGVLIFSILKTYSICYSVFVRIKVFIEK